MLAPLVPFVDNETRITAGYENQLQAENIKLFAGTHTVNRLQAKGPGDEAVDGDLAAGEVRGALLSSTGDITAADDIVATGDVFGANVGAIVGNVTAAEHVLATKNVGVGQHIVTAGIDPTFALGTGAGGISGSPIASGSVVGTDVVGLITVTPGQTPAPAASATIITVTFDVPFGGSAPIVTITPANAAAAALSGATQVYCPAASTTISTFVLMSGATPLVTGTQYEWTYTVVQPT